MKKITVIILADNKKDIITSCLKSIEWVDEKILIDLGSVDGTIKLAKKYGCRVIKGASEYNFSLWRNEGAKKATGEWLFYLDTDERVSEELKNEILSAINNKQSQSKASRPLAETISAYSIPRKNYFWGKEFKTIWPDYQLRLIKKDRLISWKGNLHEIPELKGKIGKLDFPIVHLAHRNLESCLANTLKWSKLEAKNRFDNHHPSMTGLRFLRILGTGFWDQFINKKMWQEGTEGFIEGIYQIFSLFMTYFQLWELQRKESLKKIYQTMDKNL